MRCLLTNKNLLSEFSNGEGSVLLVAPRDQRGKTRHEEVKPLQVAMRIMMRMSLTKPGISGHLLLLLLNFFFHFSPH